MEHVILKIFCEDEIHRVSLKEPVDFEMVMDAVRGVWSRPEAPVAKYEDDEGDLCVLLSASFSDFMALSSQQERPILKLKVFPEEPREPLPEISSFHAAEEAESPETAEARARSLTEDAEAMVLRSRAECEAELVKHLKEWLAEDHEEVTFEAWIAAVHPENVACFDSRVVDPRMYLEASVHRRLWNELAAGAPDLSDEERQRRFVHSSESTAQRLEAGADEEGWEPWPTAPAGEVPQDTAAAPAQALGFVPEWSDAAPRVVAEGLWRVALNLHHRRLRLNFAFPVLPRDQRAGWELLASVLHEQPGLESLQVPLCRLLTGQGAYGDCVADLTIAAAHLPFEQRLVYANSICACCPEALLPWLPPTLLTPQSAAAFAAMQPRRLDFEECRRNARIAAAAALGAVQAATSAAQTVAMRTLAAAVSPHRSS